MVPLMSEEERNTAMGQVRWLEEFRDCASQAEAGPANGNGFAAQGRDLVSHHLHYALMGLKKFGLPENDWKDMHSWFREEHGRVA